jgi:hypothetical protein
MAGAIVMYDRARSLGRFAERPLHEGGPEGRHAPNIARKRNRLSSR